MPLHQHHRFKRPLSDGILVAIISGALILIGLLPPLAVALRGIR